MSNDNKRKYTMTSENDKTLKQFFDRFYVIPKDVKLDKKETLIIKQHSLNPTTLEVKKGSNGYIVFRKSYKKFNQEQQEQIKREEGLSQRKLAKKYNCSVATINKILKDKY